MSHEVTLTEAALMLDRGQTTIREWVKTGLVEARKDNRGHWIIKRDSLLARASLEASVSSKSRAGASGVPSARMLPSLAEGRENSSPDHEIIALLKNENEHLKSLLREERERSRRLEEERTQHLAEMRALLNKDVKAGDGVISRWLRR